MKIFQNIGMECYKNRILKYRNYNINSNRWDGTIGLKMILFWWYTHDRYSNCPNSTSANVGYIGFQSKILYRFLNSFTASLTYHQQISNTHPTTFSILHLISFIPSSTIIFFYQETELCKPICFACIQASSQIPNHFM